MLYAIVTNGLERRATEHKGGNSGSFRARGRKRAGIRREARVE